MRGSSVMGEMPSRLRTKLTALMAAATRVLPLFSSATDAINSRVSPLCLIIRADGAALPVLDATSCVKSLNFLSHDEILDHEPAPIPAVMYLAARPLVGSVNSRRRRRRLLDGAQRANERMKCQALSLADLEPIGVGVNEF